MAIKRSERQLAHKIAGRIKSVAEFLSESAEAFDGTNFSEAISRVTPWAGIIGTAAEESFAPVKFLMKIIEGATRIDDPSELALIACTIAYQRSIEQTIRNYGPPTLPRSPGAEVRAQLRNVGDNVSSADFEAFHFGNASSHPFLIAADTVLRAYLEAFGYSSKAQALIVGEVRRRFLPMLLDLVSHRGTADKFKPLLHRDLANVNRVAARAALAEHHRLLHWQFHEKPVLGRERFSLRDVYVRPEGEFHRGREVRPKGRTDLGNLVSNLIFDPDFRDVILIEAPAGAGKSAFTSWLASDLVARGLKPIRIQLRDVSFDTPDVLSALGQAVPISDDGYSPTISPGIAPSNVFGDGEMFRESVLFERMQLCPYLLILDGWDEVSISASEGFRERLDRLMEGVRNMFLRFRHFPFRVILTGRPTREMYGTTVFGEATPVLRMSALSPPALETLATRFVEFSQNPPIPREERTDLLDWPKVTHAQFAPVLEHYRNSVSDRTKVDTGFHMEVMGLPLLAYLALRTISEPGVDPSAALGDPTTLYRNLIDLTAEKAGKASGTKEGTGGQHRIAGETLRDLLQRTAAAITIIGGESISRRELQERLTCSAADLERRTTAVDDNVFSKLIVSYYFRGGKNDLGCEFLHKSFREYLFAEHIVEVLKQFPKAVTWDLVDRVPYWKDFDRSDPRSMLSRELAMLLAPQWLSDEVSTHVARLIEWEIQRSSDKQPSSRAHTPDSNDLDDWVQIRQALADLWEWWGEGSHLRLQPERRDDDVPLFQQLMKWTQHFDPAFAARINPVRVVMIDAHLGDALFHLTSIVHFQVSRQHGWFEGRSAAPQRPSGDWWIGRSRNRYQTHVDTATLFAPGGPQNMYWDNYVARINAAGWRPAGMFPTGASLRGVDLEGATLVLIPGRIATVMDFANLTSAVLISVGPVRCRLDSAYAPNVRLEGCKLYESSLQRAEFFQGSFERCEMTDVSFAGANLSASSFRHARLTRVSFERTTLDQARFIDASVCNVTFDNAVMNQSGFDRAKIEEATFTSSLWTREQREVYSSAAGKRVMSKAAFLTSTFEGASIARSDFADGLQASELQNASLDTVTLNTLREMSEVE